MRFIILPEPEKRQSLRDSAVTTLGRETPWGCGAASPRVRTYRLPEHTLPDPAEHFAQFLSRLKETPRNLAAKHWQIFTFES
ncbi:MAG TPA: hypothetical protein VF742_11820 [Terracidiphilus sp.]